MSSLLMHPALILMISGVLASLTTGIVKKCIQLAGPIGGLCALFYLPVGTQQTIGFINDIHLHIYRIERINWVFALIFLMVALIANIYALHEQKPLESLCCMLYAAGALFVTLCGDLITFLFFWELMAASSLFLVWVNGTLSSKRAGFRYLLVHMFGGNMLLFGVVLKVISGQYLIDNFAGQRDMAFWFILIGVAINAAIVPLHAWLVDAYPKATVTGSVYLSSFTTKVAVLALLRMFAGTEFLIWFGVCMAIYGAIFALLENDMRKLLSYHIVSQVGFMVAGCGIGSVLAINGATAHAFSHILYKSLLFMCAGAIIYATGARKIDELGGLYKKMPLVCICFFAAALSISGMPLFNGFISKPMIGVAAIEEGHFMAQLLLNIAGIGTALSIPCKMGYFLFFAPAKRELNIKKLPMNMSVAMSVGGALCLFFGICPNALYRFLPYETDYHPFSVDLITEYLELLPAAFIIFVICRKLMEPHTALTIDTDWFYRKPLPALVRCLSGSLVKLQQNFGKIGFALYEGTNDALNTPAHPYAPDEKRQPIGAVMMVILSVLFLFGAGIVLLM